MLVSLLAAGVYSYAGPFWTLPNEFLAGFSAAARIALISSIGNLAGFVGPSFIGFISQRTGSIGGFAAAAGPPIFSAIVLVLLPRKPTSRPAS